MFYFDWAQGNESQSATYRLALHLRREAQRSGVRWKRMLCRFFLKARFT
jgi:hypothetical protein